MANCGIRNGSHDSGNLAYTLTGSVYVQFTSYLCGITLYAENSGEGHSVHLYRYSAIMTRSQSKMALLLVFVFVVVGLFPISL